MMKPYPRPRRPIPTILGIAGLAGAGKSTAARALARELDYQICTFAAPIKAAAAAMFGWTHNQMDDPIWKEQPNAAAFGRTPRSILQSLGTDWGRQYVHEEIWTSLALDIPQPPRSYSRTPHARRVFADVRFPNEAKAIWKRGGALITVRKSTHLETTPDNHASESWEPWLRQHSVFTVDCPEGAPLELAHRVVSQIRDKMPGAALWAPNPGASVTYRP